MLKVCEVDRPRCLHIMVVGPEVGEEEDINDLKQSKIVFDSKLMSWIEQRHLKVERG